MFVSIALLEQRLAGCRGYTENFVSSGFGPLSAPLLLSKDHLQPLWMRAVLHCTAAQGVGGSPSLGVFQSCGDVALRDVGSGDGVGSGLVTLQSFSNCSDSLILY